MQPRTRDWLAPIFLSVSIGGAIGGGIVGIVIGIDAAVETYYRRPRAVEEQLGGEKISENVISARDVLKYARMDKDKLPASLTTAQRRLVSLVADAQQIPLGREMTAKAAELNILYAVDNNVDGGGYYSDSLGLVAMEFKDDTPDQVCDYSSDEAFEASRNWFREVLYHELTHMYQHRVWNNGAAPEGTRSFDRKLWSLSMESQADLVAAEGMRQHRLTDAGAELTPPKNEDLCAAFTNCILNDAFHRRYYKVSEGRLDDGKPVDAVRFSQAFGSFPGAKDNFLSPLIRTSEEFYGVLVQPCDELRMLYEAEQGRVRQAAIPALVPVPILAPAS